MTWCLPLWLHNLKSILCQLFQAQKKHRTWTHRKLSPRFKTQTWFSPARGLSYLRPPQTSEKLELLPKFIINAHLYFAGIVSYQKFWVYEQRHTFLKLMLILWSQPSDFFCTHLVMGESHTFADAASHHLPHRCISCSCVRERKPPLADSWAWSAVRFNSPSYVSVNSTPKMETWESCFLTATLQWAEKLREWDAHPGSASVTTTLLLSTRARGCVSKAASIQGWPCGSAISSSYKLTHDLRSQFSSCCPLCFFLLGLGKCSKNIPSCPSKGPNIFKLYAGKVFLLHSWTEANRQALWRRTRMVSVPLREFMRNSIQ